MASIASATNIGSSGASSLRGYGGLASGLDRDTLIESMTAGTRAKIAKQQQKKQTYEWQQEGFRSISDKLVQFSRKYTSYTNPSTNLSSGNFWSRSSITALGGNSKYLTVSGSSALADNMSVVGIKQLAKDTNLSSTNAVSDRTLSTGGLNIIDDTTGQMAKESVSNLEGQYLYFKYGNKNVGISLSSGTSSDGFTYDYSTGKNAVESITKAMKSVSIGDGKTLADVLKVETSSQGSNFTLDFKNTDTAGNTIKFSGGSQTALEAIGLLTSGQSINDLTESQKTITSSGMSTRNTQHLFSNLDMTERLGDKNLSLSYNGTTKSIKFMSKSELTTALAGKTNAQAAQVIADDLQSKVDDAFGRGRVKVDSSNGKITFKTTVAGTGDTDQTSIISIVGGDTGVIGKNGALKVEYGESNRVNTNASLANSGLKGMDQKINDLKQQYFNTYGVQYDDDIAHFSGAVKAQELIEKLGSNVSGSDTIETLKTKIKTFFPNMTDTAMSSVNSALDYFKSQGAANVTDLNTDMKNYVDQRELKLTINDVQIKGLTYNSTMSQLVNAVNTSDAGVTMSYMSNSDKFSIESTVGGAAGRIDLGDTSVNSASDPFGVQDFTSFLFGSNGTDYTVSSGQDAIIGVKYAGSNDVVELRRSSNAFNMDGMNITVTGTFGYEFNASSSGDYVKASDGSYIEVNKNALLTDATGNFYTDSAGNQVAKSDIVSDAKRYKPDGSGGYIEDPTGTMYEKTDGTFVELKTVYKEALAGNIDYVMTVDGKKTDIPATGNRFYQSGQIAGTDEITFDAKVDADKIVDAMTEMIKDLNDIIQKVNDEVSTKPNRKFSPLSEEQKEELTDEQIEKWEAKAKEGILFADFDLRSLADSLRFIFDSGSEEKSKLASYGISTSTDYGENGKLVFDETKFRAALESNAEDLKELFTKPANNDTGEKGGFMAHLTAITEKYASTTGATKGILIERAGSTYAPTSILSNHLKKSIDSIDDYIERLEDQLKMEQDRYISQFTNLETLISQMNSQSSWLSSSFG